MDKQCVEFFTEYYSDDLTFFKKIAKIRDSVGIFNFEIPYKIMIFVPAFFK